MYNLNNTDIVFMYNLNNTIILRLTLSINNYEPLDHLCYTFMLYIESLASLSKNSFCKTNKQKL